MAVRERRTGLIHEHKTVVVTITIKSVILVTGKLLVKTLIPRPVEFPNAVVSFRIVGPESPTVAKERVSVARSDYS